MLHIAADALAAAVELRLLFRAERKLDHLLHAVCRKDARNAREQPRLAILTAKLGAGRHNAFSSCSTMYAIRAAVVAMPYSVHCLPENVTHPPPMDSFCRASRSKRKRSSVSAHTSSGIPRKLTQDQGANC